MVFRGDLSCESARLPPAAHYLSSSSNPVSLLLHLLLFLSLSLSMSTLDPSSFLHCPVFSQTFCLSFLFAVFCLTLFPLFFFFCSVIVTSSALRSCSTGDSLLSSAFIRSAKSAPALAPPLPVLLHHHHHPLLPPLADQLAGTLSLHYLSAWKL